MILLLTEKRESSGSKGKGTFHANILENSCHKYINTGEQKLPSSLISLLWKDKFCNAAKYK